MINGQNTFMKTRVGPATINAVCSARWECDRLGREFAEDDVQRGDDDEGDTHSQRMDRDDGGHVGKAGEQRFDQAGDRRLTDPAEREAGHGDPDLGGGNVAIGIRDGLAHTGRAPVSLGDQLIDPGLSDGDEGELRGDEEPVGDDQREDSPEAHRDIERSLVHG